jgi:hypothetical protein
LRGEVTAAGCRPADEKMRAVNDFNLLAEDATAVVEVICQGEVSSIVVVRRHLNGAVALAR